MINNHKTIYSCPICDRQTATIHEIVFKARNRQNCIEYNIQLPLCQMCHVSAHGRFLLQGYSPLQEYTKSLNGREKVIDQRAVVEKLLSILELDYSKVLIALNDHNNRQYLANNKDRCEEMIKKYEIS